MEFSDGDRIIVIRGSEWGREGTVVSAGPVLTGVLLDGDSQEVAYCNFELKKG